MSTDTISKKPDERFEFVDQETLYADEVVRKNIGFWADAVRRFKQNKVAMFFLVILILLLVMSILGPIIAGKDYVTINGDVQNMSPSGEFWFGTDSWVEICSPAAGSAYAPPSLSPWSPRWYSW